MAGIAEDLTGRKFRMLTVVKRAENIGKRSSWICQCDCGKECVVASCNLKGKQVSCGCYRSKMASSRATKRNTKHDMHGTPIYKRWRAMMRRCSKSASHCRHNYHDRGIKVCDEWANDPAVFIEWALANGFREDLELDRIDNSGNYTPENTHFVTRSENGRNRRDNLIVTYKGEKMTFVEFAERFTTCDLSTAYARFYAQWSLEEITTPTKAKRTHTL